MHQERHTHSAGQIVTGPTSRDSWPKDVRLPPWKDEYPLRMDHPGDAAQNAPPPLADLTDELIDAALERARHAVCGPVEERCYAFSYGVDEAKKRCKVSGRGSHRQSRHRVPCNGRLRL
jgi:hypothetical protein